MVDDKMRVRFAPSPTGDLHIGGARTALFNYIAAKKWSGKFVVRVEDTDLSRNQFNVIKEQNDDLIWLGINPDESTYLGGNYGPYKQTERLGIYYKYLKKLLEEQKAYQCFCSKEELETEKKDYLSRERKMNYQYSRKCLFIKDKDRNTLISNKAPYSIRLKIDKNKNYEFIDSVRGKISFSGRDIEDFIIIRTNGMPSYNFSCVIDDYLMKITNVIRGEEHLSNTGKQLAIYDHFSWKIPTFSHISIILNKDRKKLSKRDLNSKFQTIKGIRERGYLPKAVVNFILFLGWNPGKGNEREIFGIDEVVEIFEFEGFSSRGAIYDIEKLNWFNNQYIQKLDREEYGEYSWKFIRKEYKVKEEKRNWVISISALFQKQLRFFEEITELIRFFFVFEKNVKTNELFLKFADSLDNLNLWNEEGIKNCLKNFILESKKSKKELFLSLRKIITGNEKGPELQKIIFFLGKEEVLKRLR